MKIFHIATAADWDHARRTGTYTTSTLGRSLDEEGFIHAARRDQVRTVFRNHYADSGQSLVLLMIDTSRLDARWSEERVGDETYPHIHGPLNVRAVREVIPLDRHGNPPTMRSMLIKDIAVRLVLALVVMGLSVAGSFVGEKYLGTGGPGFGALAGLALGVVLVWLYYRFKRP